MDDIETNDDILRANRITALLNVREAFEALRRKIGMMPAMARLVDFEVMQLDDQIRQARVLVATD